jgi:hypothetical protein
MTFVPDGTCWALRRDYTAMKGRAIFGKISRLRYPMHSEVALVGNLCTPVVSRSITSFSYKHVMPRKGS